MAEWNLTFESHDLCDPIAASSWWSWSQPGLQVRDGCVARSRQVCIYWLWKHCLLLSILLGNEQILIRKRKSCQSRTCLVRTAGPCPAVPAQLVPAQLAYERTSVRAYEPANGNRHAAYSQQAGPRRTSNVRALGMLSPRVMRTPLLEGRHCHDLKHIRYSTSESHRLWDSLSLLALMGKWNLTFVASLKSHSSGLFLLLALGSPKYTLGTGHLPSISSLSLHCHLSLIYRCRGR